MGFASVIAGALLLALLVVDVFWTVFVPRGRPGPVTRRVYRGIWWAWRRVCRRVAGDRRRRLLGLGGPLLMPLTIVVWSLELVVGFALVYLPLLDDVGASGGDAVARPVAALYLSGYSATTLGVGDVFAQSTVVRLLSVVEAGCGFALFSVSVTYLLSVYAALQRSTALAVEVSRYLHTRSDDGLDVLVALARDGREDELAAWFAGVSSRLVETDQARAQYPLLEYFHVPQDDRALPVALAELLEVLTVASTVLDPAAFPALAEGQSTRFALASAAAHLRERADSVGGVRGEGGVTGQTRARAYAEARARLSDAGCPLRPDTDARERYAELRSQWDSASRAVLVHFGYAESGGPVTAAGRGR